jgi:hypothetical protein
VSSCLLTALVLLGGVVLILPRVRIVMRVVKNYIWRQTLYNPFVLEALIWRQSFLRVPLEASSNKINESRIWHLS